MAILGGNGKRPLPEYNQWEVEDILKDMRQAQERKMMAQTQQQTQYVRKTYGPPDTPKRELLVIANCFVCSKNIFENEDYVEIVRYNIITPQKHDSNKRKKFHCDCFEYIAGKEYIT